MHYPDFKGKMYHIKSQQIDLDVTDNHRMLVQKDTLIDGKRCLSVPTLELAKDIIGKHRRYKKNANWLKPDYQFVLPSIPISPQNNYLDVSDKNLNMDAWLVFFGIWIAEGWAYSNHHTENPHSYYRVTICQCKPRVKSIIVNAIKALGFNPVEDKDKIHVFSKQLFTYFKDLSVGAPNKFLPDWVWELSQAQARTLIYNMLLGDGTFNKNTACESYYTSSIRLADDFQRLCLHAGWSTNKIIHSKAGNETEIKGRKIISNYDMYKLTIVKSKNNPSVNHSHTKEQKVQQEGLYDYEGPVYCIGVPSEVFYVRRNGKAVWTGNSRETGPVQLLTRQPAEGRSRDGGLRIGEMERDVLIAYGVSCFLKEKMTDSSDLFRMFVSKRNQTFCIGNEKEKLFKFADKHLDPDDIREVQLPYAMKLLFQEVSSMGIDMRLKVD